MPKVSVLMSVYNESYEELSLSIGSVLNQTFTDFEFIIVNDNPDNIETELWLEKFGREDARIIIIQNQKNIGLALSLNKAAILAKGKYILRTDADDICVVDRIEKQYNIAEKNSYDLICSNYDFIDEDNRLIDRTVYNYNSKSIKKLLPFHNVIHHPTVLMKTDSFRKVGGYRNFLCAQDYDLWLRMEQADFTFYMMSDKLLYYKVRENSITGKNRLKQIYTIQYIREVYKQQEKSHNNIYSYEKYIEYLNLNGVNSVSNNQLFNDLFKEYHRGIKCLKNKRYFRGIKTLSIVLFKSKYYRNSFKNKLIFQVVRLFYK